MLVMLLCALRLIGCRVRLLRSSALVFLRFVTELSDCHSRFQCQLAGAQCVAQHVEQRQAVLSTWSEQALAFALSLISSSERPTLSKINFSFAGQASAKTRTSKVEFDVCPENHDLAHLASTLESGGAGVRRRPAKLKLFLLHGVRKGSIPSLVGEQI